MDYFQFAKKFLSFDLCLTQLEIKKYLKINAKILIFWKFKLI